MKTKYICQNLKYLEIKAKWKQEKNCLIHTLKEIVEIKPCFIIYINILQFSINNMTKQ